MPKQYVLFGRMVPRLGNRRISLLLIIISSFAVFSLLFTLPSAVPTGPSLQIADHKFSLPSVPGSLSRLNPWRTPAHTAPARQTNDTDGHGSWWYAEWKWLSTPFSSSVTFDEGRQLLPPLAARPPIYCYYDPAEKPVSVDDGPKRREQDAFVPQKNEQKGDAQASRDAQSAMLLSWRRAWWAAGFRPIILGPEEAKHNPLYEELHRVEAMAVKAMKDKAEAKAIKADPATPLDDAIDPRLRADLMRWLAWENMGGGLLAHTRLFPMGAYDDPLLTHLRRGDYPRLSRWMDLGDGLLVGPKNGITAAVKQVLGASLTLLTSSKDVEHVLDRLEAVQAASKLDEEDIGRGTSGSNTLLLVTSDVPEALALYSPTVVSARYPGVRTVLAASRADGLRQLNQLVTSHLHLAWQAQFPDGISVVKPMSKFSTHMIAPAYELASRLAQCPDSPVPTSCPPNMPRCAPCDASHPMHIGTPPHYLNVSNLYTIGTVPHPYTTATLRRRPRGKPVDIAWLRREAERDPWLADLTRTLPGTGGVAGPVSILRFKEMVASEPGTWRSLWVSAEQDPPADLLDWHFGFPVPTSDMWADEGRSETPVPGPERRPPPPPHDPSDDDPLPEPNELRLEPLMLDRASQVVLDGAVKAQAGDGKLSSKAAPKKAAASAQDGKPHTGSDIINDLELPPFDDTKPERTRAAAEAWSLGDAEAWRFTRAYLARRAVERQAWEEEEAKFAGGMGSEKAQRRWREEGQGEGRGPVRRGESESSSERRRGQEEMSIEKKERASLFW